MQGFQIKMLAMLNKDRNFFQYHRNYIYIISPLTKQLTMPSTKVAIKYIGPLVIFNIIHLHSYLLMTLDGEILRGLFEHERLRSAVIRTSQGNISSLLP